MKVSFIEAFRRKHHGKDNSVEWGTGGGPSFPEQMLKFCCLITPRAMVSPYLEIFVPWVIWKHKNVFHMALKSSHQLSLGCFGSEPAAFSPKPEWTTFSSSVRDLFIINVDILEIPQFFKAL